ncbi:MAG: LTA synthase family protein [Oscillospiraceae bacterium]|nr:LTA synthase family protein [Oscillospiraceae bacterium]
MIDLLLESIIPLGLVFLELILQFTATNMHGRSQYVAIILIAFGTGLFLESLIGSVRLPRMKAVLRSITVELFTIWFLISYFSDNSYRAFMNITSIARGVNGVVTEFGGTLFTIVTAGFPKILLYHIPFIICVLLHVLAKETNSRKGALSLLICLIGLFSLGMGVLLLNKDPDCKAKLTTDYNYDTSVRSLGMLPSVASDIRYLIWGNPYVNEFNDYIPEEVIDDSTNEETGEKEEVVYLRNELPVDFDSLIETTDSETLKNVYKYLSDQQGSYQNEYTGIFEGKNLILICAEAFSKEVIDPVLTPTLYRLANNGIVFEDYYQPAWGGSTSSGEYSVLTGIIPVEQVNSVYSAIDKDLKFTLGNQLKTLGYYSAGYHDGEYTYYDRHKTHMWFGYDSWMGRGNGMEKGCPFTWPESDLDMFKYTVPMFIEQEHFNIYYMTISGHANYSVSANAMSDKNWDAVKDLDYSYPVQSYIASNLELEYAMEYLIDALEEAGKADDTVIVLTADHYPYGLEDSTAWAVSGDCLANLYGYKADSNPARDHNALIIWCGSLEDSDPIVVSEPVYSLDIVPTLSNLFGFEYDSRFLVGRDVLSKEKPLVIWQDHSWMTDRGYYDAVANTFTPKNDVEVSEVYIETIKSRVQNKFALSRAMHSYDILGKVFE